MHPTVTHVTSRIVERSKAERAAYLARIRRASHDRPARQNASCSNLAHALAAASPIEKQAIAGGEAPNLGIVTAYNDMLSAHKPYENYPEVIRRVAKDQGAVAQVAGAEDDSDGVLARVDRRELAHVRVDLQVQGAALLDVAPHLLALDRGLGGADELPLAALVVRDVRSHVLLDLGRGHGLHDTEDLVLRVLLLAVHVAGAHARVGCLAGLLGDEVRLVPLVDLLVELVKLLAVVAARAALLVRLVHVRDEGAVEGRDALKVHGVC